MNKVYETFERDIKREFSDVTTVDQGISALDIDEYVVTQNVEDILGCFAAYFFDDIELFPNLQIKCQLLQEKYRDKVGPGVWIRGFFGAGKSHLLKVMNTIFSVENIAYNIEENLNVIQNIQTKIRNQKIIELVGNINPDDYMTFIFSANHITRTGDTIVDCLPNEISKQLGMDYDENKKYSASDVVTFLNRVLEQSGKKRMMIFIDEILDVLDDSGKVRKFEGLIELLNSRIWIIVTSLEAKTNLLTTITAERMIDRFGQEQILYPEEMVWIVKKRYLAKTDEGRLKIEEQINLDKLKYHFSSAYLSDTGDGKIEMPNIVASYPFYPFQLAYMKDLLKNAEKGSARNMMKTVKSIIKNPDVYQKDIGYFIDIELIYEELKNKRSIEDEYSDLITNLEGTKVSDDNNNIVSKELVVKVLKAIVLLSQVKPEGVKSNGILPFVYDENTISDLNKLKYYLDILTKENYINNEGKIYKPITKRESDVWSRIKEIDSVTESHIREFINNKIYKIINARSISGKNLLSCKINGCSKDIAFVLKQSDYSNEFSNIYSSIPFESDIEKLKRNALETANEKDKVFVIPDKNYEGEALYNATKLYLQMDEALDREADFGIDSILRIQVETKRDITVAGDIDKMLEDCFNNAIISYLGQDNKDFSKLVTDRVNDESEKMLKKKYTMFFGKLLREPVDTFIKKEILLPQPKLIASYLRDIELISKSGEINTANRYYNEFVNSFPEGGYERDGSSIVDEFSKGKYGWELDTIKILSALAIKNGDLKIARESRTFTIPEDIDELVSSNGPFAPRKRKNFDSYKFTKINISDEEIKKAIRIIKNLDSNMTIELNLKDVAQKIKELLIRCNDLSSTENNYTIFLEPLKNDIELFMSINKDISNRNDSEEIVINFNTKFLDQDMQNRFTKILYIANNIGKISNMTQIYEMFKNISDFDVNNKRTEKEINDFMSGNFNEYEKLIKLYKITFKDQYNQYKKRYNVIVNDIKNLQEWAILSDEQKEDVIKGIDFIDVNELVFDILRVRNIGKLDEIRRLTMKLNASKIDQSKLVHTYYDKNNNSSNAGNDEDDTMPPEDKRISKTFKSYSSGRIINIDSVDKLTELDKEFDKIKEKIKNDLMNGKKITLEL